jgi:hypothetical protein
MTNLIEPPSFDPKSSPPHYFKLFETSNGLDCIWVFYGYYEWRNNEYCLTGGIDFKNKVEVRTFLKKGMPPGFYRIGFDYALMVDGNAKWLHFAYEGLDGREHGVFGSYPEDYEWNKKHLWLL